MWTSDDEYCERVWQDYQRALKIIEAYKDSPVEEIQFIVKYCESMIENNFKEQEKNTKYFNVINLLHAEREEYKHYASELEKSSMVLVPREKKEIWKERIKRIKQRTTNEEYFENRYKEFDLWFRL